MQQNGDGISKALGYANIWESLSLVDLENQLPRAYFLLIFMPEL